MSETWVITKREFRSYFLSPIAYVVGALFLLIGSYQFFQFVFVEAGQKPQARMGLYFQMLPMLLLFVVAALSMRLWAEERKLGTLELLLTFPVKTGHLIGGKFLGAMLFVIVLLALTCIYPLTLASLGNLDWGATLCGYFGAVLLASAYLSLGMFMSSLTRDQIVALLLTLAVLGILYTLPQIAPWFMPAAFVPVAEAISPLTHFQAIAKGVVDVSDLIFYAAFSAFFLFLNALTLEARKWLG